MRQTLLQLVVCPNCHGDLTAHDTASEGDHILFGHLACNPIVHGVPHLYEQAGVTRIEQINVDRFAYSWKTFDSGWENDKKTFLEFIAPVQPEHFQDKRILDAGCGMGRFSALSASFGAAEVVGMDLGDSVFPAYQNTQHLPNVHIVRGNIFTPPFKKATFDYAFSVGVLHHLPEPQSGFNHLVPLVKPGGDISVWVYGQEGNEWVDRYITPVRKLLTARLPMPLLMWVARLGGFALFLLVRGLYAPARKLGGEKASRILPYYNYFQNWIDETLEQNIHTVLDHLLTPIAFYLPREEVETWFSLRKEIGTYAITSCREYSWCGFGSIRA
ncbi:MAG: methyltransferase domain-containing protein [bacterium]|nr:methyltransferase domain-containing protein [bacterium]